MKYVFRLVCILITACFLMQLPLSAWSKKTGPPPTSNEEVIGVRKPLRPDLVISRMTRSPGDPKVNEEITLSVWVKNIGQGVANTSSLRAKVGGEQYPPEIIVMSLNPGEERLYTKKFTIGSWSSNTNQINIIVKATADQWNHVVESNEGNNVKQMTIMVKRGAKPDLVVTKINYSPGSPKQHEQVKVWIFVKNIGTGKSDPCYLSEGDTLNYTLNSDSDPGWKWTNKHSVPALDPGREHRCDGLFISNSSGTYYLKCFIDREDIIVETNEENNRLERKIVVGPLSNE